MTCVLPAHCDDHPKHEEACISCILADIQAREERNAEPTEQEENPTRD